MTQIIEAIDAWTLSRYTSPTFNAKLYGFCELMKKSAGDGSVEQNMPVTIPLKRQVAIDDKFNFQTWMRWINPATYEATEEWQYGNREVRVSTLPLRLVLVHRTSLGENIVWDFVNNFPDKFTIDGFQFVFTNAAVSVDPDHEAIVQAELGPSYIVYEKHRFDWNVYVININVQFLECE